MAAKTLKLIAGATVLCAVLGISGCSNASFKTVSANILSSTGVMSAAEAEALFDAGGHVVDGFEDVDEVQEYYLGRAVAATILDRYPPYRNQAVTNYVNKVGNVVAAYSDRPAIYGGYHFMVLDTEELNALAAPGGFIFVTRGLLRILPDEDALAGALAHEVGHVALKHGLNAIKSSHLTKAFTLTVKGAASRAGGANVQAVTAAFGDSVNDMVDTVIDKGYSRSQEYDADEYAAKLLKSAGYNPNGLLTVLARLEAQEGSGAASGGLLSTHPETGDRISNVKSEIGTVTAELPKQAIRTGRFKASVKPVG